MNEQLIKQFEQNYYSYSNEVRAMLLKLSEEELINKLARDSKMSQMKMIVFWGDKVNIQELLEERDFWRDEAKWCYKQLEEYEELLNEIREFLEKKCDWNYLLW